MSAFSSVTGDFRLELALREGRDCRLALSPTPTSLGAGEQIGHRRKTQGHSTLRGFLNGS